MLPAIAIVLVLGWGIAVLGSYTLGGYVHVVILAALALLFLHVIRTPRVPQPSASREGRRP